MGEGEGEHNFEAMGKKKNNRKIIGKKLHHDFTVTFKSKKKK